MVYRVAHKIQDDATNAALIHLTLAISSANVHDQIGAFLSRKRRQLVQTVLDQRHNIHFIHFESDSTRVIATHLEKVGEHDLKSLNLSDEELYCPGVLCTEGLPLFIENIPR